MAGINSKFFPTPALAGRLLKSTQSASVATWLPILALAKTTTSRKYRDPSRRMLRLGGYQDPKNPLSATIATAGWTWVNGQGTFPGVNGATGFTQSFSDWAPGEPNDYYGPGSEQYMAIGLEGQNLWNDEGALGNISGYVVEFSCVPDNNSLLIPMGLTLVGLAVAHRRFAKTA